MQKLLDQPTLFNSRKLKPFRTVFYPFVKENFGIKTEEEAEVIKITKQVGQKRKNRDQDMEYINKTKLRAARLEQLEKLNTEGAPTLRVLDGVAIDDSPSRSTPYLITGGDQLQLPAVENVDPQPMEEDAPELSKSRKCYICKTKYRKLHFFYDQLCPTCAELNYRKRNEMVDMSGKVCLVTGARVKIGFRCALKLLRCGAIVIATTRFPHNAAQRFAAENDYQQWKDRLFLFGLDFRNMGSVEIFCLFVKSKWSRLDVIINNACQTVRRPPTYYQHLIGDEKRNSHNVSPELQPLLNSNIELESFVRRQVSTPTIEHAPEVTPESSNTVYEIHPDGSERPIQSMSNIPKATDSNVSVQPMGISSYDMTQLELIPEDKLRDSSLFPEGITDVNQQQVDLREKNSWVLKLEEVSTPEIAEVMVINAIAPAVINAKLKPLMERDMNSMKFIVNVSAMEGKFYRYKSATHPHTNMAKAALNMMTRTSAQDYLGGVILCNYG
jgi:NAD(P)-dependent dehydrogenase (short-subunit alcohol dehydrogenase family)